MGAQSLGMTIALVLCGPPGSGKSLLAQQAAQELRLPYIGSGDIARNIAKRDEATRRQLESGDWAPEGAIRLEVRAQIEAAAINHGAFVIDGFPRRIEQLYLLESIPDIYPLYFMLDLDPLQCLRRTIMRRREGEQHEDAVALRWRIYHEHTESMLLMLSNYLILLDGALDPAVLVESVVSEYHLAVNHD